MNYCTGKFTSDNKGPSSLLSHNRCFWLQHVLTVLYVNQDSEFLIVIKNIILFFLLFALKNHERQTIQKKHVQL